MLVENPNLPPLSAGLASTLSTGTTGGGGFISKKYDNAAAVRKYQQSHREEIKQRQKIYREKYKDKEKARKLDYHKRNPGKAAAYTAEYRLKNPEKCKESDKATKKKRHEINSVLAAQWREKNRDYIRSYYKQDKALNPGRYNERAHRRRALELKAPVGNREVIKKWQTSWKSNQMPDVIGANRRLKVIHVTWIISCRWLRGVPIRLKICASLAILAIGRSTILIFLHGTSGFINQCLPFDKSFLSAIFASSLIVSLKSLSSLAA